VAEAQIQQEILLALGRRVRLWRQNAGKWRTVRGPCPDCARRSYWIQGAPTGAADLSGILNDGRRLEIEVKAALGQQSPEQANWQRMIESRGGVYILARSAEEAERWI